MDVKNVLKVSVCFYNKNVFMISTLEASLMLHPVKSIHIL